jgi:hypothetical protein
MRMLLRAMGFWIWGLIAISVSVSVVTLSYRLASNHHWYDTSIVSSPSGSTERETAGEPRKASSSDVAMPKAGVISRVIAKDMRAAQSELQAGAWNEALRSLDAAETKSPLTAFDVKTIDEFKAYAYLKSKSLKQAQAAYEAELATGAVTAQETVNIFRTLFGLTLNDQQHATAIKYGEQLAEHGAATPNDLALIAQSYYQLKDCKNTTAWADKAVAAARKAGEAPKENLYLFKLQCASDAQDNAAMVLVLSDLIRLNNKSTYWNTLLRIERLDERDDHNTLMIYRTMYDTGAMTVGTDYIEMAQLLGDAGLPGEAQTTLEKAMNAGLISDQQKERTNRLLSSFKTRAETDKKSQAQFDAEASKNPAGELDLKLGEVYYGSGDYQNAVTAINRGLQKGQIKHPDDAYVYLGRSQVALNDLDGARASFANLKTVPNLSPKVFRLWNLYAETLVQ